MKHIYLVLVSFFLCTSLHAQKGEWYMGINLNSGINPSPQRSISQTMNHAANTLSLGGGLFAQYQFTHRFGLMFSPTYRHTTTKYIRPACHFPCPFPTAVKRNSLELPVLLSFRMFENSQKKWQGYLLTGYSFDLNLFDHASYTFGGDGELENVPNFYPAAHQLIIGAEFRVAMGKKAGFTCGIHYTLPLAMHSGTQFPNEASHYQISMLALHLRFGGIFR